MNILTIFYSREKNRLTLGIIFLLILAVSAYVFYNVKSQEYDGIRINLSGRQRMLSQKMTKESLHYKFKKIDKDDVLLTIKVFNTTLIALKDGGDAPLDLSMAEFKTIPEMEVKETKDQLGKVMSLWVPFKQKIESVLENRDDTSSMDYIIDNNTKLLDEMDAAVVMMQHTAEKKVTRLFSVIILAIFISILIFIASLTREALRRRAEELEETNRQLIEANRLKSVFLATMSHELRTPLNSIIGFTGVILQGMAGKLNEEQRKQLTMVESSADHLLMMINELLDISKIEAGKMEHDIEEFDLSSLVRKVENSFTVAINKKGLKMTLEIPEKLLIKSDEQRTKQVIINLVGNAVKFTDKGEIRVGAVEKKGIMGVSVKDTGPGIREEDMDKLFKAFSRISAEETQMQEGTGLGLYLSQKIANLLGGEIKAKSELGKGSEFIFTLPLEYKRLKA